MKTKSNFNFSQISISFDGETLKKYRKEKGFYKSVALVGLVDGQIIELAQVKYYKTQSRNYACLWLSSPILGLYGVVGAFAGGYGYNREDAAFSKCLDKINVISTGHNRDSEFFEDLACYFGVNNFKILSFGC